MTTDKENKMLREANRQLCGMIAKQAERILELEQKLAAKSWLKRFLNWLDRNFN